MKGGSIPLAPILGDTRELIASSIQKTPVVFAGPSVGGLLLGSARVDFSQAGLTRGLEGEASSLVFEDICLAAELDMMFMLIEDMDTDVVLAMAEDVRPCAS